MAQSEIGAINFQGLASGINTADIVDALVKVARIPIKQLEKQNTILQSNDAAYSSVLTALGALRDAASGINRSSELKQAQALTTDATVIGATAGSGATYGSHTVVVQQLAAAQRSYSNSFADAVTPGLLPAGSFSIDANGVSQTFTVDASSTLTTLQQQINAAGLGLQASIVNEGSTARLALVGSAMGAANAFTISESGATLGFAVPCNTVQLAQDATVLLDGVSQVRRSSNTINDLLSGVSLQLQSVSSAPQTVTVEASSNGMVASIEGFVAAYNKAVSTITAIMTPGTVEAADPQHPGRQMTVADPTKLPSDTDLGSILRNLQRIATGAVTGADPSMVSLAMIGISTAPDGTLSVDSNELGAAVNSNPDAVAALFVKTYGVGDGVAEQIYSYAFDVTSIAGPLMAKRSALSARENMIDANIRAKEGNLALYEIGLKRRFTDLEMRMSTLKSQTQQLVAMLQKPNS